MMMMMMIMMMMMMMMMMMIMMMVMMSIFISSSEATVSGPKLPRGWVEAFSVSWWGGAPALPACC